MSVSSLVILIIAALLLIGIFQRKNKVVSRLCGSLLCAVPFAVLWFIFTLFTMAPVFGSAGIWYVSIACIAVYSVCLLYIWKLFTQKRRRIASLSVVSVLFAAIVVIFAITIYQNSISEMPSDEEANLYRYMPFIEDTRVKSLDEPSNLRLDGDLPRLDGATALYPLYSAFVRAVYPQDGVYSSYGDLEITGRDGVTRHPTLLCSTTSKAFDNLISGSVDIVFMAGVSDEQRARAEDLDLELRLAPIGSEAFVFLVNQGNPVSNLTVQNVRDIYSGNVTNWRDVGGRNDRIRAYQRPQNSGSQTMLEQIMDGAPIMQAPERDVYSAMGGLYRAVADYRNYRNALGYSFRYYINDMMSDGSVKLLSIDGVEPTVENIANGSYPFAGNFFAITVKRGGVYINAERTANIDSLLEWITSPQGQYLVEATGYVPIVRETNNPGEITIYNGELDYKSILHTETGGIFSLGDPAARFEEAFGPGEKMTSALEVHHEGEFERFRFYVSDEHEYLLVEFLDDRAVEMLTASRCFEFAHISFDTRMDDLPDAFFTPEVSPDNNRRSFLNYDSDGNIVTHADRNQVAYRLEVLAHFAAGGNIITAIKLHWFEPLY